MQEYWSELPCPPPGDLPNPGIESRYSALQADSLLAELPGKSNKDLIYSKKKKRKEIATFRFEHINIADVHLSFPLPFSSRLRIFKAKPTQAKL